MLSVRRVRGTKSAHGDAPGTRGEEDDGRYVKHRGHAWLRGAKGYLSQSGGCEAGSKDAKRWQK